MCRFCGSECVGPCYDGCMCKHCWRGWSGMSLWTRLKGRFMHILAALRGAE